ncbi:hypothetical protein M0804_001840 [Polistes exclamans]|nr:hypothetical protein M0804_001840 [Polistes exclamans]
MLKGGLPPYLDARNEDNSFYMTLSNGPHTYVAESTNTEPENYNHNFEDVYFITPILCKHCEDYIWGSGKVGVACKAVDISWQRKASNIGTKEVTKGP